LAPYLLSPASAALAVAANPLFFYCQRLKTVKQLDIPLARLSAWQFTVQNIKMAAIVGALVGTQMVAQDLIEKNLFKKESGFYAMLASSLMVGTVSSPILAMYNGLSGNLTFKQSWNALSVKQLGSILGQETIFLLSRKVSGPVNEKLKKQYGESNTIRYGSSFLTGTFGAFLNHPANTTITFLQNKKGMPPLNQLMRGCVPRALSVGMLLACCELASDVLKPR
jgi:hypothetical protein